MSKYREEMLEKYKDISPEPLLDDNLKPADLLLKEYDHRFTEMIFHSGIYSKQIDYIQLFVTVIVLIGSLLFSDKTTELFQKLNFGGSAISGIYGMFFIVGLLIQYSLFSKVMDSLFMIYLNGLRIAAIEIRLNNRVREEVLIWDSKIIPLIFGNLLQERGWIRPNLLAGIWVLLLFLIANVVFCFLCYLFLKAFFLLYLTIAISLYFFHLYQWILLHTVGINYIKGNVFFLSGVIKDFEYHRILDLRFFKGFSYEGLIAIATFLLGFWAFLLLGIFYEVFWPGSVYNFPLILIPTIMIGDSLLLPYFNYRFTRLIRLINAESDGSGEVSKKHWLIIILVSISVSIGLNIYNHYLWINDSYTGYLDLKVGELSILGWWHLAFSIIQTTLILIFAGVAGILRNSSPAVITYIFRTGLVISAFSLLSLADFVVRHLIIFHTPGLTKALSQDWISLVTIPVSFIFLIIIYLWKKRATS